MDNPEGNPLSSSHTEASKPLTYPVRLRTHHAKYLAAQLQPSFDQEKHAIQQRDGTFQENMDFLNKSPFGSLMQRLGTQPEETSEDPDYRVINLSEQDKSLIINNITTPPISDWDATKIHNELMEELEMKFDSAKGKAKFKSGVDKLKGIVTRS